MADNALREKIENKFKLLDKDKSGWLNHSEVKTGLKEIYAEMDLKMTDSDIDRLIKSADKNNDGKIQIQEFMDLV